MSRTLLLFMLATLAGCPRSESKETGEDEEDEDSAWRDTAPGETGPDETTATTAYLLDFGITVDGFDLVGTGPDPGFRWLGLVQQGTEYNWEAEACTGGQAGYDFCHPFTWPEIHLAVLPCMLDASCVEEDLAALDPATETLFWEGIDFGGRGGDWAWVLANEDATVCVSGGPAAGYYTDLGCPEF